jgi:hypothetical protein
VRRLFLATRKRKSLKSKKQKSEKKAVTPRKPLRQLPTAALFCSIAPASSTAFAALQSAPAGPSTAAPTAEFATPEEAKSKRYLFVES